MKPKRTTLGVAFLILLFFLSGCEDVEDLLIYRMPLYKECIGDVEAFSAELNERYKDTKIVISFDMNMFDTTSAAHETLVGFIQLTGSPVASALSPGGK